MSFQTAWELSNHWEWLTQISSPEFFSPFQFVYLHKFPKGDVDPFRNVMSVDFCSIWEIDFLFAVLKTTGVYRAKAEKSLFWSKSGIAEVWICTSPFTLQGLPHQMSTQEMAYEDKIVNQMLNGQGSNCGLCTKQEASFLHFYFLKISKGCNFVWFIIGKF